jgi:hypothetical protein
MFVILSADPPPSIVRKYRDALQLLAPKLWPPPAERDQLEDVWAKTTSIVIVRHPLARLASVYYQVEQQSKKTKVYDRYKYVSWILSYVCFDTQFSFHFISVTSLGFEGNVLFMYFNFFNVPAYSLEI